MVMWVLPQGKYLGDYREDFPYFIGLGILLVLNNVAPVRYLIKIRHAF